MFQIFCEIDAVVKELDITDVAVVDLNFQLSDISDPSSKNSSYSKTISLPATSKNLNIFKNIWNVSSELGFYTFMNPNYRIRAWITLNSIPVLSGYLKLENYKASLSGDVFEITIYASTESLFSKLEDKELTDLNLSGLNHTFNKANIINSWNNEVGYYYPLIDAGYGWGASNVLAAGWRYRKVDNFAPAVSLSYLFRRIINEAGYTVQSDILNSTTFKNAVIPCTRRVVTDENMDTTPRLFYVGKTSIQQIYNPYPMGGVQLSGSVTFENETTAPYHDENNFWSGIVYTHHGGFVKQRFTIGMECIQSNNFGDDPFNDDLHVSFYRQFDPNTYNETTGTATQHPLWAAGEGYPIPYNNMLDPSTGGAIIIHQHDTVYSSIPGDAKSYVKVIPGSPYSAVERQGVQFQYSTDYLDYRGSTKIWLPLLDGEQVRVKVNYKPYALGFPPSGSNAASTLLLTSKCYVYNEVSQDIIQGMTMPVTASLPKKIKQKDFIMGIINAFNLYVEPDRENDKLLRIESRDTYYASGKKIDWSKKVLDDQEIQVKFLSDNQPKSLTFAWKDDKDYYNTYYKNATNDNYGNVKFNIDNDFSTNEKKIELPFSPSPLIRLAHPDSFLNIMVTCIEKELPAGYTRPSGEIESNIRLLMKKKVDMPAGYQFGFEEVGYSYYPYCGHLDNPVSPTFDMNLGVPAFPFFDPSTVFSFGSGYPYQNLTYTYWRSYLKQISDPDAKVVTFTMKLTAFDIYSFSFRDKIYIANKQIGNAYYYINKISGYDGNTAKVEMIKLKP